jgi:AraC family transcriptional regulator of adaptative response / DNA-3-methyladenine glycosylase II
MSRAPTASAPRLTPNAGASTSDSTRDGTGDDEAAYRALCTRDARFDGRLFVGVRSTGIYCRPICRVRTPLQRNCRFFGSHAQAEAAGFRPCLKCRPEIAPGWSLMDSSHSLAQAAARALEQAVQGGQALTQAALAARLGISSRHLHRIFVAAHGVGPQAYLATHRLLLAKQLLTDTSLPVTQVALACGYGSLRRFHAEFAQRYRLNPGGLRQARSAGGTAGAAPAGIRLRLAWRPPLDAIGLLGHFARRSLPGLETVEMTTLHLRRTLRWPHGGQPLAGWLALQLDPQRCEVQLDVSPSLAPALGALLPQVRQALDLDADPLAIDPTLALLPLPPRPGLRLPGCFCSFEAAVRVILGQQVTVRGARTLLLRLLDRFGTPIETPFEDLWRLFPSPACMAAADPAEIGRLGIVRQRVRALQALAAEMASGRLLLQPGVPIAPTLAALQALPGIGDWTAQVIAMRTLAWPDAWPARDVGLWNALGSRDPQHITRLAEAWRPWRAYAVMRLWHRIETGE